MSDFWYAVLTVLVILVIMIAGSILFATCVYYLPPGGASLGKGVKIEADDIYLKNGKLSLW